MEPVKPPATPPWMRGLLLPSWLSFILFLLAFILLIVGFSGSKWYTSPEESFEINGVYKDPPNPVEFGLFWLCHRGHCLYSMQIEYMVVAQIKDPDVQRGYEKYLTPIVVVMVIGFIFGVLAMVSHLGFLSGFSLSPLFGFPTAICSILAGVISIIGCIIFGSTFRGGGAEPPFGRSFWLTVIGACFMVINGAFMIIMAIASISRYSRMPGRKPPLPFLRR